MTIALELAVTRLAQLTPGDLFLCRIRETAIMSMLVEASTSNDEKELARGIWTVG